MDCTDHGHPAAVRRLPARADPPYRAPLVHPLLLTLREEVMDQCNISRALRVGVVVEGVIVRVVLGLVWLELAVMATENFDYIRWSLERLDVSEALLPAKLKPLRHGYRPVLLLFRRPKSLAEELQMYEKQLNSTSLRGSSSMT